MNNNNTMNKNKQPIRPSLGRIEEQRRRKLESAIPDVRKTLDAALADADRHAELVNVVAPLVALVVAEIAVLDRQTDAADSANVRRYGAMIETALGLHDEPWRAFMLWRDAATAPLEKFGVAWAAYLERITRDSEGRHHHQKLVNLEHISRALNLTRPRIAAIFGAAKCSLPPILLKDPTFTKHEQRDIRALSQRVDLTTEYLRDLALTLDPVAFCDQILIRELLILPDIDKHRILNSSDVAVSKSFRRWCAPSKPGPKPKAATRESQIEVVARHRRVSERTIWRLVDDYKAWLETPKTPDPAVTVAGNSCHSGREFDAVRFRDFDLLLNLETPESITLFGTVVTDPDLVAIASLPKHKGPRTRVGKKRYDYADKALVIAWWEATRNETPSPAQIRQWASRGHYDGYRNSSLLWKQELELRAQEDAEDVTIARAA